MKKILLMILLVSSSVMAQDTWSFIQADYSGIELKIDVKEKIKYYDIVLEVDEMYYPVTARRVKGSTITLLLSAYQNYYVRINDDIKIYLSALGNDIVDDRDLIINSDVDYNFKKGTLVFNYPYRETHTVEMLPAITLNSGSKQSISYDKKPKKTKRIKKKNRRRCDKWKRQSFAG